MQIYYFPIKSPSPLHPVFAGVGLAGVVVVPEEERFVNSAKLQIIPDRLFFLCKPTIFLLEYDLICSCVVHCKIGNFYSFTTIIVESSSDIPCYKPVERRI